MAGAEGATARVPRTATGAGAATREKMLAAAERLFAERTIDTVTTRDIMGAAGVNAASIHYHFGSKRGLIEALLRDRLAVLLREQEPYLDALEGEEPPSVDQVVDAFVRPFRTLSRKEPGRHMLRFLAEASVHPDYRDLHRELSHTSFSRRLSAVRRLRPDLSYADAVAWTTLVSTLAWRSIGVSEAADATMHSYITDGEVPDIASAVHGFLVAAFRSPPLTG